MNKEFMKRATISAAIAIIGSYIYRYALKCSINKSVENMIEVLELEEGA